MGKSAGFPAAVVRGADPASESELLSDTYANPQPNLSPSADYHHGVKNPLL